MQYNIGVLPDEYNSHAIFPVVDAKRPFLSGSPRRAR